MVKWLKGGKNYKNNKNRYFRAQQSGHNVTPALAEYGIAKRVIEGDPREMTIFDYILFAIGLAFFAAVLYFGVGYYYDTCNAYGTFEFGGVNYYGR